MCRDKTSYELGDADTIVLNDDAIAWAIKSPDAKEGNAAFFEKRPANWVEIKTQALPPFGRRNANPFGTG